MSEEQCDPRTNALELIEEAALAGEPHFIFSVTHGWRHIKEYAYSFITKMHHPNAFNRRVYSVFISTVLMYSIISVPYRISISMPGTYSLSTTASLSPLSPLSHASTH